MPIVTDIRDYEDENGNVIVGAPKLSLNAKIIFAARNCRVEIAEGVTIRNCTINMSSDGGVVRIGRGSTIKSSIRVGLNSSIIIGERLSSTGRGIFSAGEGTTLTIGDDCMFALDVDIRTDHAHPIFDRRTGQRINKSKSLTIGDHVWLGPSAMVYPGAKVGEGCVIGARSLVNGAIPPNCVAVGVPARVTRRDIVWDKRHVSAQASRYFDDISTIPRPWQSEFPVSEEEAPQRIVKRWFGNLLNVR